MFWNYRLLKTGEGDGVAYTLVEAYYDEGVVTAYAEAAQTAHEQAIDAIAKALVSLKRKGSGLCEG